MVQSTVEKLSPTRVKIAITVTPDELKPSIQHAYKHIAESVNIPGFRKGKVPPPIIDQRVGRAEVLNHAVSEGLDTFYREAVAEQNLRTLGRPAADITEWPSEKDFSGDLLVTIEVDVRPEFELPKYDGLKIEVDAVDVTPDEVEAELENLRSRFGTLVTVESRMLGADAKRLHHFHIMRNAETGAVAATFEVLSLTVDMTTRKAGSLAPADLQRALDAVAAHATLPLPDGVGRAVAMKR